MAPSLQDALDAVAEWRAGGAPVLTNAGVSPASQEPEKRVRTEEDQVAQNTKALAELQSMMPGLAKMMRN